MTAFFFRAIPIPLEANEGGIDEDLFCTTRYRNCSHNHWPVQHSSGRVLALVGLFLFAKPSEIGITGILIYGSGIISGVVFVAAGEVARALIDIARYCASLPLIENNTSRMVELFELTANRGGEVPRAESPPL